MARSINYNTIKGSVDDILEEFIEEMEEEILEPKIVKINKKKKRFDDGTLPNSKDKKIKNEKINKKE